MVRTEHGGGTRGMLNLWGVGLAVVLLTTLAINEILRVRAAPAVFVFGGWLLLSPWIVGFTATVPLMWNSVIFGALIFIFGGWSLIVDPRRMRI